MGLSIIMQLFINANNAFIWFLIVDREYYELKKEHTHVLVPLGIWLWGPTSFLHGDSQIGKDRCEEFLF